jgi:uncharacterized membrane protein YccC
VEAVNDDVEIARELAAGELRIAEGREPGNDRHERAMAAEQERRMLVNQAMRHHISNVSSELRRYEAELDHINAVCDDRMSS